MKPVKEIPVPTIYSDNGCIQPEKPFINKVKEVLKDLGLINKDKR